MSTRKYAGNRIFSILLRAARCRAMALPFLQEMRYTKCTQSFHFRKGNPVLREYYITKNDSGQRLNKFLEKAVPLLPGGMMHKYLRLKRIKVNGKRTEAAYRLC